MAKRSSWATNQERNRIWIKKAERISGIYLTESEREGLNAELRATEGFYQGKKVMERYPHLALARRYGIPLPGSCPVCEGRGTIRATIPNPALASSWGIGQGFQYFQCGRMIPCPEAGCTVNR